MSESALDRDPPPASAASRRAPRLGPILVGALLLLLYVRLAEAGGYSAYFGMPGGFLFVAPSELRFWLTHLMLVVPAVVLLAHGFGPWLEPLARRAVAAIDGWQRREWRAAGLLYFTLLLLTANLGRSLVMLDMPFTDDENGVIFGSRMVAEGHLRVPVLQPKGAFTDAFTYERDGYVASMDFPGLLFFGALAILSRLDGSLYALVSAAAGLAVAYAAGLLVGPRARVVAALAWLLSPMALSLSITSHGHVPSRAFVALALAFAARLYVRADIAPPRSAGAMPPETETAGRDGLLVGLFTGLGFLCRPSEVGTLLFPTGVWMVLAALRPQAGRARLPLAAPALAIAGLLPAVLVFAWYNHELTGSWHTHARLAQGVINATAANNSNAWTRLGFHLGWNAWLLGVFALGVPALVVTYLGAASRAAWAIALTAGIALALMLSLAHDNVGVHSVGPIHYSECIVPIVLLFSAGAVRLIDWIRARGLPIAPIAVQLAAYLVVSLGIFDFTQVGSLHAHARVQRVPFDALAQRNVHNAVVLAPQPAYLVQSHPQLRRIGSWVLFYPHPDPFFRDDVIFVNPTTPHELLRERFPNRRLFAMGYDESSQPIKLTEIPKIGQMSRAAEP